MALFPVSDEVKRVVTILLTVLATVFLGVAQIFGWALPNWAVVADIVVLLAAAIFGIEWVPPKKPGS